LIFAAPAATSVTACAGRIPIGDAIVDAGPDREPIDASHGFESGRESEAVVPDAEDAEATVVDAGCPSTGTLVATAEPSALLLTGNTAYYTISLDSSHALDSGATMLLASLPSASATTFGATFAVTPAGASIAGKRVRARAQLMTADATTGGASLWLRADAPTEEILANGSTDPIVGTTPWQSVDQVIDVPSGATNLVYGSILYGTGEVWIGPIVIEQVEDCVPLTTSATIPFDGGLTDEQ
jgi:hypothetical protein